MQKIPGINKKILAGVLSGIGVFIVIIVLNFIIPNFGTIGIPNVQSIASETGRFITIVIIAPIIETFFFFGIILFFFQEKLFKGKFQFIISSIITSTIFSLFHINAYGNFSSSNADFILAGVMGLVFSYQTKFAKSVIPAIVTHVLINLWIGFITLADVLLGLVII